MSDTACHAGRGTGMDTALWMDADSRIENRRLWQHSGIRDAAVMRWSATCDLRRGATLLRRRFIVGLLQCFKPAGNQILLSLTQL